ncbi:hypothetical protein BX600DRAFT_441123 [Xylariales sp. PMI_506]|nr:hypothetical protein BX600DRAFT_441123 [Xylariales sp. PMI_506]
MAVNGEARGQSRAQGVLSYGQRQVDRIVSPQYRQRTYEAVAAFATERPLVFAFIVAQLLFSSLPLVLFASFAVSTCIFALISAVIFSLFWIGVAMLFLVPALLVTFGVAVLTWLWAVATFIVGRWIYNAIPAGIRGGGFEGIAGTGSSANFTGGKHVIFPKSEKRAGPGTDFDDVDIKSETAEVKE